MTVNLVSSVRRAPKVGSQTPAIGMFGHSVQIATLPGPSPPSSLGQMSTALNCRPILPRTHRSPDQPSGIRGQRRGQREPCRTMHELA